MRLADAVQLAPPSHMTEDQLEQGRPIGVYEHWPSAGLSERDNFGGARKRIVDSIFNFMLLACLNTHIDTGDLFGIVSEPLAQCLNGHFPSGGD